MTKKARYQPQSPFSKWVRSNPALDSHAAGLCAMDIDWVWHRYRIEPEQFGHRTINHIMLIEEKSNGYDLEYAQRDTMLILDQLLRYVDSLDKRWTTSRGERVQVRAWGYFSLRYSGFDLINSEWILWNNKQIDLKTLTNILLFKINPRTLDALGPR